MDEAAVPTGFAAPFWQLAQPAGRTALWVDGQAITHGALATLADEQAAPLAPRQVFALACAPTLATVALYLGALRRGAVPLLLDATLPTAVRQALLAHYQIHPVFDGATGQWHTPPTGHTLAGGPLAHPALGLLLSTSGSTGSPKLVRLSQANLQANAASIVQALGLGADEVAISTLPLHYSYGLSVLNSHLACGASLVLTDQPVTAAPFWQLVATHGVTSLSGVPTLWRLLRRMRFERLALPSVRSFTQAGGRLDADEVRWLHGVAQAGGRRLHIMYGQTEATARIACLDPALLPAKAGSVGQAIPGVQLQLLAADGTSITSAGQAGELVVRGPNVMLGYAEQPADLALGGCTDALHTGDLAEWDTDGCLWITGRLKRFIKLFGHRLNLDEVELWLRQQGLDAAATGRDDLLMVALATAEAGADDAADALRQRLAQHLRAHPSAVRVRTLPALPLGSNGKPPYAELLAWLETPDAG